MNNWRTKTLEVLDKITDECSTGDAIARLKEIIVDLVERNEPPDELLFLRKYYLGEEIEEEGSLIIEEFNDETQQWEKEFLKELEDLP